MMLLVGSHRHAARGPLPCISQSDCFVSLDCEHYLGSQSQSEITQNPASISNVGQEEKTQIQVSSKGLFSY